MTMPGYNPFFAPLLVVVLSLAGITGAGASPRLKSDIRVDGNVVTLGDVFEDAGDGASVVIANAPAPGRRATLPFAVIGAAARDNNIEWDGRSAVRRITVERSGHKIPVTEISRALADALKAAGVPGRKKIRLSNPRLALFVAIDADAAVTVEQIDHDPANGRFEAVVVTGAGADRQRQRVTGQAVSVLDIPVLRKAIARGAVISAADLTWTTLVASRLTGEIVTDRADMVGLAARRSLRSGVPVRMSDLQRPVIITKGSLVTMLVQAPALTLTAVGRALENGSDGDTIRILNTASHTTVQAIVVASDRVRVPLISHRISAMREPEPRTQRGF